MGLFKKSKTGPPPLSLSDINSEDENKIKAVLVWFLKNDSQVRLVASPALQSLFENGYGPKTNNDNSPTTHYSNKDSLVEWFGLKMILNFKLIRTFTRQQLLKLLDDYGDMTTKTIQITGKISTDYKLNPHNLSLDEMKKIPNEKQAVFMQNYIDDSVLSSEMRILAWVYFCSFGTHYKDDSNWTP